MRELVDNVWSFLDKTSDMVGKLESDRFSQEMHANCLERGLESPIEDLFWIACHAMCKANYLDINPEPIFTKNCEPELVSGIYIKPQAKIGTYKVDFLISQHGIGPDDVLKPIVVELDGHDFHDKDKRQRSYEKARDRYLIKQGYKVFHYTGSDVVADPFKVAFECLSMLGMTAVMGYEEYTPNDPLGLEI